MTTEEQRCEVCGRSPASGFPRPGDCLRKWGGTSGHGDAECYRLGYTRANERAEGLAKELEALRAAFLASFKPLSLREMFKEDGPAAVRFWDEQCDTFCSNAQSRSLEATARVAEMQDRMVAAFGEGTTADQLVAISHEHEARVAELEKQLTEVTTELGDAHENGSATAAKWRNRADKAEAELARLRALPAGLREELESKLIGVVLADVALWGDSAEGLDGPGMGRLSEVLVNAIHAALAAPLPSAQQVGAAPVDISLGECSAWTAGHNPEGVEDRGGKVSEVVCDYKTAWHSLVPHPETKSCIRPRAHPAEGPPAPGGEK